MSQSIAVLGAGISGLRCASILKEAGFDVQVYEKAPRIGGRMMTDHVDGFLLDHGFHVMQSAYPTSQRAFDFKQLGAKAFEPGAVVVQHKKGKPKFWRLADPFRRPLQGLMGGLNGFASPLDLLRVARLRFAVRRGKLERVFEGGDEDSRTMLQRRGFSQSMFDRFFYPLFSGIFLEKELRTNERMFRFVFRMMSEGDMILPRDGIAAAPQYLAETIGIDRIHLNSEVEVVDSSTLNINGSSHTFDAIVHAYNPRRSESKRHVWTLHFNAPSSPFTSKHIMLNGDVKIQNQLIAHIAVPSDVQPSYAPDGRSLVTVTVVGETAQARGITTAEGVENAAVKELRSWFGSQVDTWQNLATQHIEHALPEVGAKTNLTGRPVASDRSYACGDHTVHGSVEGALLSAEHVAQQVLESLNFEKA